MDSRVRNIAGKALRRLEAEKRQDSPFKDLSSSRLHRYLMVGSLSLAQLARLADLRGGDPVVDEVISELKASRPVYLDRSTIEKGLRLREYPALAREELNRWFSRIADRGVTLTDAQDAPPSRSATESAPYNAPPAFQSTSPEREILCDILGEACPEGHPCLLEPGQPCCGSGRCKSLGF